MRPDTRSLIELGVLPDVAGAWPLATWLDHTHARSGHEALKRLIGAPLDNVTAVRARQQLLRELVIIAPLVPWRDLYELASQVDKYLQSNYVFVPRGVVQRALFAARFGDIMGYVAKHLRTVDALLSICDAVYTRLAALPNDVAFAEVVTVFRAAVSDSRRMPLRAAVQRGQELALCGLDDMVRSPTPDASGERPMRGVLSALVSAIAQLDAFCSLATASDAVDGALPELLPRGTGALTLEQVRHPMLERGVANDVQFATDDRVVFLTGPNMAGKSTLLRTLGIAVHSAHLGMAVAARAARIPLYDQLLVSITVRDDLQRGESLYLAEIRRVQSIVTAVDRGDAVLAVFDEVFRGTNIKDATQATTLLVDGLARASCGTFVIASHLAEVAAARAEHSGVACWRLEVDLSGGGVHFTYRLQPGVSDVHLGMVLLDSEGVGPMLRRMAAASVASRSAH